MGRTLYSLVFILSSYLLLQPQPCVAGTLDEISALGNSGSLGLAMRLLDRYQPPVQDVENWIAWERERLNLYDRTGKLDQLIEHITGIKQEIPEIHARWLLLQAVHAYLARGEGHGARRLLVELIWGMHGPLNRNDALRIRRLLVRSMLYENLPQDALVVVEQYQKEFGAVMEQSGNEDWYQSLATVYFLTNNLDRAQRLLMGDVGDRLSPLKLLIALRHESMAPEHVLRKCRQILDQGKAMETAPFYWAIIAEAAGKLGHSLERAHALEQSLTLLGAQPFVQGLYVMDADSLWDVYRDLKASLGHVLGIAENARDSLWIDMAHKQKKKNPFYTRFIYAMLAMAAKDTQVQMQAHSLFAKSVLDLPKGDRLLQVLYLQASRFPTPARIPAGVRHIMIGQAINEANTPLASRLMRGLSKAPEGVAELDWKLRRARVHIMAGQHQQGTEVILGMLKEINDFTNQQLDRLVQVLFDLQAVGEHRTVIPLFEIVLNRTGENQRKRELFFWIAESMQAMKEYDEAARYYLKSANFPENQSSDLWGQSAQFKAAEMLTMAGLPLDARKIYQGLLKVTTDPGRRSHLERNIQQLAYRGQ